MPTQFDAFISHGKKDSKAFAIKLYQRLTEQGFNVWLDQNDIPSGVDFQNEIDAGIEKSHSSVESDYCRKERDLAIQLNKRIIPILHVMVSKECWDHLPPAIKKLNFNQLCFHDKIDFEDAFPGLVEVLRRDADYVKQHTRILTAALLWDSNYKQTRYLLIGEERNQAVA
ncbi:MAG TPA: toll/interleukin-1 receptor domain-containing protein [Thioploca sp.]|nr:toll/interleukin-1 receptor domain-containing protein [Thioploca sp.]